MKAEMMMMMMMSLMILMMMSMMMLMMIFLTLSLTHCLYVFTSYQRGEYDEWALNNHFHDFLQTIVGPILQRNARLGPKLSIMSVMSLLLTQCIVDTLSKYFT